MAKDKKKQRIDIPLPTTLENSVVSKKRKSKDKNKFAKRIKLEEDKGLTDSTLNKQSPIKEKKKSCVKSPLKHSSNNAEPSSSPITSYQPQFGSPKQKSKINKQSILTSSIASSLKSPMSVANKETRVSSPALALLSPKSKPKKESNLTSPALSLHCPPKSPVTNKKHSNIKSPVTAMTVEAAYSSNDHSSSSDINDAQQDDFGDMEITSEFKEEPTEQGNIYLILVVLCMLHRSS